MASPSKDELFQRLREENEKLERQVSILSQWNERQQQDLTIAEENLEIYKKKYQESVERMAKEHATTLKQYKIELEEKDSECSRLQRKLQKFDVSFSHSAEPPVKGKEVNGESKENIHEKEKDKTLFERRRRSAGPSNTTCCSSFNCFKNQNNN